MKFTKINLSNAPFIKKYSPYKHCTDFENWHKFIKDNELYSYCQGWLPVYSTLKRYFETSGDHGWTLHDDGRPPEYDHGYMYKTKDKTPILVYQPYGALDKIDDYRQSIERWATERGIQAKVFGYEYGWYNSDCYLVIMGLDLSDIKVEKALNTH
jgi:hypothetical protein